MTRSGRQRARGYTVVELMMALAVFATGVTGIIAMERAAVSANQHARNVALATAVAQSWLGQLATDATLWKTDVTSTTWLTTIQTSDHVWQLPAWNDQRNFGPEFDGFGAPVKEGGIFCAQIRLTWLYGDASAAKPVGIAGNGVIRTEVRVFWPRDGATRIAGDCTNNAQSTVDAVAAATDTYHFVVQSAAVRQLALKSN